MIIRKQAEADLAEAHAWYEKQRAGLGIEFLTAVDEAFERIESMPEMYRVVHNGLRRAQTRRFPFTVYYRMEDGQVGVVGILHSRRDPHIWKSRT